MHDLTTVCHSMVSAYGDQGLIMATYHHCEGGEESHTPQTHNTHRAVSSATIAMVVVVVMMDVHVYMCVL